MKGWTTLALVCLPGGLVMAAVWLIVRALRRRDTSDMSTEWLQNRLRESRVSFEGVSWKRPFNRERDYEQPWANRYREQERRKRA